MIAGVAGLGRALAAAHPSGDLTELAVPALGILIGVPALLLLIVLLVVTLAIGVSQSARGWTSAYGAVVMVLASLLAAAYPAALLAAGRGQYLDQVLALDLPAIGVALWVVHAGHRLRRRAREASRVPALVTATDRSTPAPDLPPRS